MAVIVAVSSKNINTLPIGPSKARKPVCSSFQNKCNVSAGGPALYNKVTPNVMLVAGVLLTIK
jgi:hypothetical protein